MPRRHACLTKNRKFQIVAQTWWGCMSAPATPNVAHVSQNVPSLPFCSPQTKCLSFRNIHEMSHTACLMSVQPTATLSSVLPCLPCVFVCPFSPGAQGLTVSLSRHATVTVCTMHSQPLPCLFLLLLLLLHATACLERERR